MHGILHKNKKNTFMNMYSNDIFLKRKHHTNSTPLFRANRFMFDEIYSNTLQNILVCSYFKIYSSKLLMEHFIKHKHLISGE